MSTDIDYSQQRSLNLGIAIDTGSLGAAAIYDDLVYAQKVFGNGYFFRSYDQMMKRFPLWSERTIRNYIRKLEERGWVSTKVMKVNGKPTCHYKVCRFLSAKIADTKETVKIADSINIETKKKRNGSDFSIGADSNTTDPATATPAHVTELLEKVIQIVNPKEKVIKTRLTALNARLKEYTSDEITLAARAFSQSEWHRDNKQMSVDNLLAPSKFGRWYTKGQELSATDIPLDREDIDAKLAKERKELDEKNKNRDWGFGDEPK